jgi:hypothetical protein
MSRKFLIGLLRSVFNFLFIKKIDEQRLKEIKEKHLELIRKSTNYPRMF